LFPDSDKALTAAGNGDTLEQLRLQLRHVEGQLAAARGSAAGLDVNLTHVDDVIALKTQVANLMAELESEKHAAREVGALRSLPLKAPEIAFACKTKATEMRTCCSTNLAWDICKNKQNSKFTD